jgi:hypothetical protein
MDIWATYEQSAAITASAKDTGNETIVVQLDSFVERAAQKAHSHKEWED